MYKYIIRRLLFSIPTLIGLTLFIFVVIAVLMPVDAVDVSLGTLETGASEERKDEIRESLGLNDSAPQQYLNWVWGVVRGDFGDSLYSRKPVIDEISSKLPVSLEIGLLAITMSWVIGTPIGIMSAVRQDSIPDYLARGGAILLYAVPGFWLAILLLLIGGNVFGWAPSIKYVTPWDDPVGHFIHILPPVMLLGLRPTASVIRLVRTQVLEVIRQDYVRTARAKGLGTREVYFRHVLRNALLPLVTVIGLEIPSVVSGTIIYENIFLLPGMGRYLIDVLQKLDLFAILALNLLFGTILVTCNLIVDVSYGFIDPRVRVR